jgi:hypothetical protein
MQHLTKMRAFACNSSFLEVAGDQDWIPAISALSAEKNSN